MKHIFTILFMLITSLTFAQVLSIDLASIEPGKEKTIDFAGQFDEIALLNRLPKKEYTVTVKLQPATLAPLPDIGGAFALLANNPCKIAGDVVDDLKLYANTGDSEIKLKEKIEATETILETATSCPLFASMQDALKQVKTNSVRLVTLATTYKVKRGQDILIVIQRDDKTWTFKIEGGPVGLWLITYGYGLTSLRGQKEYYANQITDTTYSITPKRRNDVFDLEYTPSIFFSFLPYQSTNKMFYYSLSGGLGFDADNPTLFFGPSLFFRQNLGLSAGIAFKKIARLNTRYNSGDIIEENLEFDQLHDKTYRPLFYVSLNFRFKENPFKKKESGESED